MEWQRLTGDAEERVVSFIKKEHQTHFLNGDKDCARMWQTL